MQRKTWVGAVIIAAAVLTGGASTWLVSADDVVADPSGHICTTTQLSPGFRLTSLADGQVIGHLVARAVVEQRVKSTPSVMSFIWEDRRHNRFFERLPVEPVSGAIVVRRAEGQLLAFVREGAGEVEVRHYPCEPEGAARF